MTLTTVSTTVLYCDGMLHKIRTYSLTRPIGCVLCFTAVKFIQSRLIRPICDFLLVFHCNYTVFTKKHFYGRPLSVSGRPCYVLPMFIYVFVYFLWPPYSPALVNGGSRKFYTWWTLSVSTWIFSWSSLNYRVGQKVTKFWRIFRRNLQTFCSHARTRQNIVILKKNLLSTDGCSTRNATFGELWPTNPWDPRATKFLKSDMLE